ncbi:MAG: type IV toxin-antitoxin system AbiEi family antitoxin domain-containing protein [Solirubrobacterales bacterium]
MGEEDRTAEERASAVASASKGVATRQELLAAGVSDREIERRRANGSLIDQHPGTYRVGHRAPSVEATYLGAVRACGPGALLCGPAAAWLWGLIKGAPPQPEVISLAERRIAGIVTHRARRQPGADGAIQRAIPVTTVARTLVDLAGLLPSGELAKACHEAGVRHNTTPAEVEEVLKRRPASKGAGKLRRVMSGETKVLLSKLELGFQKRLREAQLPLPVTNKPAGGRRVDCRWPEHKLTVELDSYRFHRSRHAWEQDRRREREARARGDDFRRYTWDDVFVHPRLMMRELIAFFSGSRPA